MIKSGRYRPEIHNKPPPPKPKEGMKAHYKTILVRLSLVHYCIILLESIKHQLLILMLILLQ